MWNRGLTAKEVLGAEPVVRGTVRVEYEGGSLEVNAGQAVVTAPGEWVRYSTPGAAGAEYVAVCLPPFSPSFDAPSQLAGLTSPQQFAFLRARAQTGGAHGKLLYGAALQKLGRPLSARREFAAAAALAPNDANAQVAAAVGLFDKTRPAVAFSRLGPLVKRFPHAVTVRFHLGLMLLWLKQIDKAKAEFRKARAEPVPIRVRKPGPTYAHEVVVSMMTVWPSSSSRVRRPRA